MGVCFGCLLASLPSCLPGHAPHVVFMRTAVPHYNLPPPTPPSSAPQMLLLLLLLMLTWSCFCSKLPRPLDAEVHVASIGPPAPGGHDERVVHVAREMDISLPPVSASH